MQKLAAKIISTEKGMTIAVMRATREEIWALRVSSAIVSRVSSVRVEYRVSGIGIGVERKSLLCFRGLW